MIQHVLTRPGNLEKREVPTPTLEPGDVLLRVGALTLCGSDVRVFTGEKTGGVQWPTVLGHEFSGEVVQVGSAADDHLLGTHNAVIPWVFCGACPPCRRGQSNLCPNVEIFGYQLPGGMSEYVRIPRRAVENGSLVPVSSDMPAPVAALSEPAACVFHGHLRCRLNVGSSVLILGGGPIGTLHTKFAFRAGASRVLVSEPDAERAARIRGLGAVVVDPIETDVVVAARELTDGEGVDASIVCIGIPQLAATAIASTRPGGVVNLFAGFGHRGVGELDLNAIHYNQLDVVGNVDATVSEFYTAARLIAAGEIEVESMISHTFPLAQAHEALEVARSGRGMKVVIVPDGDR